MHDPGTPLPHEAMRPHDRFREALTAYLAGTEHPDDEALTWIRQIEDEALLCQYFGGWGDLEAARTRRPDIVDRALLWMRAKQTTKHS